MVTQSHCSMREGSHSHHQRLTMKHAGPMKATCSTLYPKESLMNRRHSAPCRVMIVLSTRGSGYSLQRSSTGATPLTCCRKRSDGWNVPSADVHLESSSLRHASVVRGSYIYRFRGSSR